ncbi:hypothetical protein KKH05_00165 [Patescibacteria group bacterium]|nr:hypothetical protein [Patescibacteria group bacterium]
MLTFEKLAELSPELSTGEKRVVEAWEAKRLGMEPSEKDRESLDKRKKKFEEAGALAERSRLAEAVIGLVAPLWLVMPEKVETQATPTEQFDDVFNNADIVEEMTFFDKDKRCFLRWAEDVTRRHPDSGDNLRNKIEIQTKVESLKRYIKQPHEDYKGREAGRVKYFISPIAYRYSISVGPVMTMPRAIISFPDGVIADLADSYFRSENKMANDEIRERARGELAEHPARREYLAQVLMAMEAEASLLKSRNALLEDGVDKETEDALKRVESIAGYIRLLLGSESHEVENQWLVEAYEAEFGEHMESDGQTE